MPNTNSMLTSALLILFQLATPSARAEASPKDTTLTRRLQMSVCYVKEDADGAWQFRIVGDMPHGPGIYVIVYDEIGDIVHRAAVPYGAHAAEKPYVIDIPADDKVQQYVIKLLGSEANLNGMILPLTSLPHEVYGGSWFSFGGSAETQRRIVAFQGPSDGQAIQFSGYKGDYRILDEAGAVVADSKDKVSIHPQGRGAQTEVKMTVTLSPGKTYWLEPYGVMYLGILEGKLYLTFDPERWFAPNLSWTLESRPWWKGLVHE